jgi:transcriptional activator SPT7
MSSTPLRPAAVNGFARAPNGSHLTARRGPSVGRDARPTPSHRSNTVATSVAEDEREDDPIHKSLTARWEENQAAILALFSGDGVLRRDHPKSPDATARGTRDPEEAANPAVPRTRPARVLDEDYGDDDEDEDEEDEEDDVDKQSPLKSKGRPDAPNGLLLHPVRAPPPLLTRNSTSRLGAPPAIEQAKTTEEVRKQLEEDKKAAAEAAKRDFQSMFFTLENDRDAMLEQQKLDELDREVENEMSGDATAQGATSAGNNGTNANGNPNQGSLGSSDLGASSLTLKHLIARIDMSRTMVKASDHQLRTLITEVRKGRSKWASEDKVGQEELYEACEKVLMELKAMTEYAQPFLQRVSKREAPDYFNVIKHPMDIGTMIKKLKQMLYKSKKDFVDDVNLIWANCLKYNQEPSHPLRKKALYMRKETDKLTPLIPEIVVRDRAEIEAEERRLASMAGEDSDDDDAPIMASRGRKAPKKGVSTTGRKAPDDAKGDGAETTTETKPGMHASANSIRGDFLRADSEMMDVTSVGTGTPPPGFATPAMNGLNGLHAPGSHSDLQEVDSLGQVLITAHVDDLDEEDTEFKTWKQVTKRDRAQAAAERNRLFRGEQLNLDEPALLRTRAMMRRWTRQQRAAEKSTTDPTIEDEIENAEPIAGGESLAEGIETEQDSSLPDYYNPLHAIPDLDNRWKWTVDSEGGVIPQADEWMRMYPRKQYTSISDGTLSKRMEANMKQMQDTRQICAKIGIVKQMQLQAQVWTTALRCACELHSGQAV